MCRLATLSLNFFHFPFVSPPCKVPAGRTGNIGLVPPVLCKLLWLRKLLKEATENSTGECLAPAPSLGGGIKLWEPRYIGVFTKPPED